MNTKHNQPIGTENMNAVSKSILPPWTLKFARGYLLKTALSYINNQSGNGAYQTLKLLLNRF